MVDDYCEKSGESRSQFIRAAIAQELERKGYTLDTSLAHSPSRIGRARHSIADLAYSPEDLARIAARKEEEAVARQERMARGMKSLSEVAVFTETPAPRHQSLFEMTREAARAAGVDPQIGSVKRKTPAEKAGGGHRRVTPKVSKGKAA